MKAHLSPDTEQETDETPIIQQLKRRLHLEAGVAGVRENLLRLEEEMAAAEKAAENDEHSQAAMAQTG